MARAALVSVEEYLCTIYEPDCDYVDGEVQERNVGELEHSEVQSALVTRFRTARSEPRIFAYAELRLRVGPSRYRISDVCVFLGTRPAERVPSTPPFLCVEILSPEDRVHRLQERIDDYLRFGVPFVWVIDPLSRRGWVYTKDSIAEAIDGVLRTSDPEISVPIAELFDAEDAEGLRPRGAG